MVTFQLENITEYKSLYHLKLNWDIDDAFVCYIDENPVALLECDCNKDNIFIYNFEVFSPGKGYGKVIIEQLKEYTISLYPSDINSRNFGEHLGFTSEYDGSSTNRWVYTPL